MTLLPCYAEGKKSCSDIGRLLAVNDLPARCATSAIIYMGPLREEDAREPRGWA